MDICPGWERIPLCVNERDPGGLVSYRDSRKAKVRFLGTKGGLGQSKLFRRQGDGGCGFPR